MTVVTPKFEVWKFPKFDFETVSIAVGSWYTKFDFGRIINKLKNRKCLVGQLLIRLSFENLLQIASTGRQKDSRLFHANLLWRLTFNEKDINL